MALYDVTIKRKKIVAVLTIEAPNAQAAEGKARANGDFLDHTLSFKALPHVSSCEKCEPFRK